MSDMRDDKFLQILYCQSRTSHVERRIRDQDPPTMPRVESPRVTKVGLMYIHISSFKIIIIFSFYSAINSCKYKLTLISIREITIKPCPNLVLRICWCCARFIFQAVTLGVWSCFSFINLVQMCSHCFKVWESKVPVCAPFMRHNCPLLSFFWCRMTSSK